MALNTSEGFSWGFCCFHKIIIVFNIIVIGNSLSIVCIVFHWLYCTVLCGFVLNCTVIPYHMDPITSHHVVSYYVKPITTMHYKIRQLILYHIFSISHTYDSAVELCFMFVLWVTGGCIWLTHLGRDKMDAISQTITSSAFSCMKIFEFLLKFHWSLLVRVQLTIFDHWFRLWLGAVQATSNYLNQWWLVSWRIYAPLGLNELT